MFKGKTNFKSTELRYLNIRDYQVGMHTNGADGMLPKNSLSYIENMDYSETGGLMSRQRLVQYPGIYSSDTNSAYPAVSVGHLNGQFILLKGANFYYVGDNSVNLWNKITTVTINSPLTNFSINAKIRYKFINFNTINLTSIINLTFSAYNQRYITVTNTLSINSYVGKYIKIGNEYRYITSNTVNTIYINGMFDNVYTTGPVSIHDKLPCLIFIQTSATVVDHIIYGNSPGFLFKQAVNYYFYLGEVYRGRLFYTRTSGSILYFTEIGITDYTPNNNYIKIEGIIKNIKSLGNRLIIYTNKDIIYLYGSSPSDFRIEYQLTSNILSKQNAVTNGNNVQFYMSDIGLQMIRFIDNKVISNSLSISNNINDIIRDYTSTVGIQYNMVVYGNKVYIGIGFKVIVYDIAKSQRFKTNLFTVYDLSDVNSNQLDPLTKNKPTFITNLNDRIVFGVNGNTYSFFPFSQQNKTYYYGGVNGKPLTIISNKIDFQSGFRDKIFRRLKLYLTKGTLTSITDNTIYQIKIYIKFDDMVFNLVKTTNNLNDEVFISGKFKNMTYKIEIMPQGSSVTPIEITNLSIGYSLLSKM